MRQLPRVLARGSLDLLTIMYPDPQFKAAKENRRIVSTMLVSEYAYYLRPETGVLCTCTDVPDLGEYMRECVARNGNFSLVCEAGFGCGQGAEAERVSAALQANVPDPAVRELVASALAKMDRTADAERHQRKDTDKRVFKAVWVRRELSSAGQQAGANK